MNTGWTVARIRPYTQVGIRRLSCMRCGNQAEYQWQICADGRNYRPICPACDIELNKIVLKFMKHPEADKLVAEYAASKGAKAKMEGAEK